MNTIRFPKIFTTGHLADEARKSNDVIRLSDGFSLPKRYRIYSLRMIPCQKALFGFVN